MGPNLGTGLGGATTAALGADQPEAGAASATATAANATAAASPAGASPAAAKSSLKKSAALPAAAAGGAGAPDPVRAAAAKTADGFIAASAPGNTAYKIGPQDVIEINVFQVAELSRVAQVADNGAIGMPLLGELPAAGKTAQELERDLARRLTQYLQKPQVSVIVKEYNSQRITLEGAVKKPGVLPLRGKTSLLQTIAQAEGFSDTADTTVVVFRQTDKGRAAARFDVAEIRAGNTEDPLLQSGDVIVVGTSALKEGMQSLMKIMPLASVFALL